MTQQHYLYPTASEPYPEEFAKRMRVLIWHDPDVVWKLIRAKWETKGKYDTTQECLLNIGFSLDEIAMLKPRVALSANNKLSRIMRQFVQDNPDDIPDLCHELEMTLPELAAAIDMPYDELNRVTDKYFGAPRKR